MRDTRGRASFPALTWLLCALAGGFVVENIFLRWFKGGVGEGFLRMFALSPEGVSGGFVWSLVTHGLLHDPNNFLHLCFVLLTLFVFGRAVVAETGPKHLLIVFTSAVVVGGLAWLAVNWTRGERFYGAASGVSALLVLFSCINPRQPITFFVVDIGIRAKHLALGLAAFNLIGLLMVELPGHDSWFVMSHSAQLGGMFTGWVYFRYVVSKEKASTEIDERLDIEPPAWLRKARKTQAPTAAFKVDVTPVEDMRAEIDRILDKINSEGFQSLTAEEKHRLDHARDHLSRR